MKIAISKDKYLANLAKYLKNRDFSYNQPFPRWPLGVQTILIELQKDLTLLNKVGGKATEYHVGLIAGYQTTIEKLKPLFY